MNRTEAGTSAVNRIVVGVTGASGMPIARACLQLIGQAGGWERWLVMTPAARLTIAHELGEDGAAEMEALAEQVVPIDAIGTAIASGSFKTCGMLVVPCSMKTAAGICSGYTDNALLRAADVTVKEQRPLVLCARETPMSSIHLRNLYELSRLPGVHIIPPMMTFYHHPSDMDAMVHHIAAKLLEPFGIEAPDYRRWQGM